MATHIVTLATELIPPPTASGLWLPVPGTSTLFYYHSLGGGSTCTCQLCEHRATTASLTIDV